MMYDIIRKSKREKLILCNYHIIPVPELRYPYRNFRWVFSCSGPGWVRYGPHRKRDELYV